MKKDEDEYMFDPKDALSNAELTEMFKLWSSPIGLFVRESTWNRMSPALRAHFCRVERT
jgi:hypothetical protein